MIPGYETALSNRSSEYLGTFTSPRQAMLNGLKPVTWTPDWKLTLTHAENTIITCRLCRGTKFVYSTPDGIRLRKKICQNCLGTGKMKTWDGRVSKR